MSAAFFTASNPGWSAYKFLSPLDYAQNSKIAVARNDYNIRYIILNLADATGAFGYVARLDIGGRVLWSTRIRNSNNPSNTVMLFDIATDYSGNNVYVVGTTYDSALSRTVGILVKFNSAGSMQWYRVYQPGASGNLNFYCVVVDSSNNVIVSGSKSIGLTSGFIGKWDSSGTNLNIKRFVFASPDVGNSVAVDSSNNIYICGTSVGYAAYWRFNSALTTVDFNKRITASTGGNSGYLGDINEFNGYFAITGHVGATNGYTFGEHFFVGMFNSNLGTPAWTRTFNIATPASNQSVRGAGIDVDDDLYIYAVGQQKNTSNGYHMYMVKLDTSGNIIWQRKLTDTSTTSTLVLQSVQAVGAIGFSGTGNTHVDFSGVRSNSNGFQPYSFVGRIRKDGYSNTGTAFVSLSNHDLVNTNQTIAVENLPTFIENDAGPALSSVILSFTTDPDVLPAVPKTFRWAT